MLDFIAEMYGPQFLAFYAVVIALAIVACRELRRALDSSRELPLPFVPSRPDPYEIAYLRGGENELLRLVVFELVRRGFLEISGEGSSQVIRCAPGAPSLAFLSPLEKTVFEALGTPRSAEELFSSAILREAVGSHCRPYEERFRAERLLASEEWRRAQWRFFAAFLGGVLALGAYKLAVALSKGRTNVLFLVLMSIAAIFAFGLLGTPSRLTERGRRYLERVQLAFEGFKGRLEEDPFPPLVFAAYGARAFAGTEYGGFSKFFRRSSSTGCGSGCGSCGGSCSGGDGCGGGCGGCGGCGD